MKTSNHTRIVVVSLLAGLVGVTSVWAYSMVEDALAFAHEAAHPYVENEGFIVREEVWGGDLPEGGQQGISVQLFRGNEYWFWAGVAQSDSVVHVNIYDAEGKLAETSSWQKDKFAAAQILPPSTGTYYVLVRVEKAKEERTHWGLVYGYR